MHGSYAGLACRKGRAEAELPVEWQISLIEPACTPGSSNAHTQVVGRGDQGIDPAEIFMVARVLNCLA